MALDVKQLVIQSTVQRFEESLQHMYNLGFEEGKKSVQKTGHWIQLRNGNVECQYCNTQQKRELNYCPYCGSRMVIKE